MPEARRWNASRHVRLADLISSLSYALDLTESQATGHAQRCCVWGMRLAECAGLKEEERAELYYALLLKDVGCSSSAARLYEVLRHEGTAQERVEEKGWSWAKLMERLGAPGRRQQAMERLLEETAGEAHEGEPREAVALRSSKAEAIALSMGFGEGTARAVASMDERWDGSGQPEGLRGEQIPMLARILSLSQTLERFHRTTGLTGALAAAARRSGRWFDPGLVRAAHIVGQGSRLEYEIDNARETVARMAPASGVVPAGDERLELICEAFAEVVDTKSPFTSRHSRRVTRAAVQMAEQMGLEEGGRTLLRRAALLHDIGKLGVPLAILEKPGRLTAEDWLVVRAHPRQTEEILRRIPGFEELALVAGAHHERLDGSGYHEGRGGGELSVSMRILAVADVYDALAAERPYRAALEPEDVFRILSLEARAGLDAACVEALKGCAGVGMDVGGLEAGEALG